MVRPRGWHLDEKHLRVDGAPMSASLFDLGLFAFHNADALARAGPRPVLLPAQAAVAWKRPRCGTTCWRFVEARLGLPIGHDEGHRADRDAAGRVRDGRDPARAARRASPASTAAAGTTSFPTSRPSAGTATACCPSARQVTMTAAVPEGLLGTADPDLPPARRARDGRHGRADPDQRRRRGERRTRWRACAPTSCAKSRAGHDGTWVAHPALIPLAREIFDAAHARRRTSCTCCATTCAGRRATTLLTPRARHDHAAPASTATSKSACATSPPGSTATAACRSTG